MQTDGFLDTLKTRLLVPSNRSVAAIKKFVRKELTSRTNDATLALLVETAYATGDINVIAASLLLSKQQVMGSRLTKNVPLARFFTT